jgi:hypothetical protein
VELMTRNFAPLLRSSADGQIRKWKIQNLVVRVTFVAESHVVVDWNAVVNTDTYAMIFPL